MRLLGMLVLLGLCFGLLLYPTSAQNPAVPQSELKLVSPNGKNIIYLKAADDGVAIWLTDRATGHERLASLSTSANGGPAVTLHENVQTLKVGFDAALFATKDGGGGLQLARGGKVVSYDIDNLPPRINEPQRAPLKKTSLNAKAGCACGVTGECTCGPQCFCGTRRNDLTVEELFLSIKSNEKPTGRVAVTYPAR